MTDAGFGLVNKDNVFKNIINKLQNKQDAETIEDKFVDSKIEELSKDPKLKNSILNLSKINSNLDLRQLKEKFINDELKKKKIILKQIFNDIKDFKELPTHLQNKFLFDGYKQLEEDIDINTVVDNFLKNRIKNSIQKENFNRRQQQTLAKQTVQSPKINKPEIASQQPTSPQEKQIQQNK